MSNEAMTWAFGSGIPPGPRFVLVTLADQGQDHSGEDWSCFPSIHKLVQRTGYGRATVQRHLTWLWKEGWITRARRRRRDGTLGINDFILHREEEDRARLKNSRVSREETIEDVEENQAVHRDEPCPILSAGDGAEPCPDLSPAMSQKRAEPCPILSPQEPLREPLDKPTGRAREPGDAGFEAGLGAYPESGRRRTDEPAARASWALACDEVSPDRLVAAVARYAAEDPDLRGGDYGAPAFERWLSGRRWRAWLASGEAKPAATVAERSVFGGPADLRDAVVADQGEAFARSVLDPCAYAPGPPGRLIPRTGWAEQQLRLCRRVLLKFGVVVEREWA